MARTIEVIGMACENCEAAVAEAVEAVAGVDEVSVDLEADTVAVDGDAVLEEIEAAVTDAGYEVVRGS